MANKNPEEPILTRRPFKNGEKEKHFALLAKNELALRKAKATVKKCQDAIETILDDIQEGGYALEAQGNLDVGDEDEGTGKRASA